MNFPQLQTASRSIPLEHRDCQVTLELADGGEFTWTIIRDQNMRWVGDMSLPPVAALRAEWFDNPPGGSNGREA